MIYAKLGTNTKLFSATNQRKSCTQEVYSQRIYSTDDFEFLGNYKIC